MSVFDFDKVIPYDEYLKSIYYHAEKYEVPPLTAASMVTIADGLFGKCQEALRNGQVDISYYYCWKCLQLFDKEKRIVDIRKVDPKARKVMETALVYAERLREGRLQEHYSSIVKRINDMEPERQKTIALQLQDDTTVPPTLQQHEHDARRQQLLSANSLQQNALMALLIDTKIPSANTNSGATVTPPQYSQPELQPTALLPQYTTYQQPSVPEATLPSPTRAKVSYDTWRFNPTVMEPISPRRGIVNLGNTCYMNSVLQVLNASKIGDYFATDEYINNLVARDGPRGRLTNSFCHVMRELRRGDCEAAASASPFKRAIGEIYEPFEGNKQQDANEFLRVLLDGIHSELNTSATKMLPGVEIDNTKGPDEALARSYWWQYTQCNSSIVTDLCAFQERSSIECPTCGQVSRSFFPSLSVELPIPNQPKVALEDCFDAYCKVETLDSSSLYNCSNCKNKVAATKKLLFYSVPKILFIALKRFRSYGDFSSVAKVNQDVFFNRELDMSHYICSSFSKGKYILCGIVNHQGNLRGGHYTADVKGGDGLWAHISDEEVTKTDKPNLSLAYILCYMRADE